MRPLWFDDEVAMSEMVPKELGMPLLVDTHAVVSHFAFHDQVQGLLGTDLVGSKGLMRMTWSARAGT